MDMFLQLFSIILLVALILVGGVKDAAVRREIAVLRSKVDTQATAILTLQGIVGGGATPLQTHGLIVDENGYVRGLACNGGVTEFKVNVPEPKEAENG